MLQAEGGPDDTHVQEEEDPYPDAHMLPPSSRLDTDKEEDLLVDQNLEVLHHHAHVQANRSAVAHALMEMADTFTKTLGKLQTTM